MRLAAEKKDERGFADKLVKALGVATEGAKLVPLVVQAAGALAPIFGL